MRRMLSRVPSAVPRAALLLLVAGATAAAPHGCSPHEGGMFVPVDSGARDTGSTPDPDADLPDEEAPPEDSETPPDEGPIEEMDATVRPDSSRPDTGAGADARADAPRDTAPPPDTGPTGPVDETIFTTGTAMDAPTRFGGTDAPARAPTVVYPPDGVVIPPNLPSLEVHFRPAAGTSLFELTFDGTGGRVRVYTGCTRVGDGCAVTLTEAQMALLARASQPGDQVRLTIAATSSTGEGGVGRSAERDVGITDGDLRGGVYYWSAAEGAIVRYEFGLPGARAEAYLRGGLDCAGCHVLSRDGEQMFVGRGIPGFVSGLMNVTSRAATGNTEGATFASFSPDSTRVLTSNGSTLTLRDGTTAARVAGLANGAAGTMPDWAPDGRNAVIAIPSSTIPFPIGQPGHSGRADLFLLPWSGTAFGAPRPLARSMGDNYYYPSYAPDSRWVLFNRAGDASYDAVDAHLWAVAPTASGGEGTPVHLANADGDGDLSNSWPRFAPFTQTFRGQTLYWFTFSSRRDYGLRLVQERLDRGEQKAQLWMAGFLPSRTSDPSTPAFWVPFQNIAAGNHIAQWTNQVRRRTCENDMDCANGEQCRALAAGGICVAR